MGDLMLIYRCYVVCGGLWMVVAAPLVLAVAGVVCIVLSIYYLVTLPSGSAQASPYREFVISTWALTIAINVLTTCMCSVPHNNMPNLCFR